MAYSGVYLVCCPRLFFLILLFTYCQVFGNEQQAPVTPDTEKKILIPNLPAHHYQFWLRNHPLAFKQFKQICSTAAFKTNILDSSRFISMHTNLSLEDPLYLADTRYGRSVLSTICSKLNVVMKSCWGYENNCVEIYLMPECYGSKMSRAANEHEQKENWFKQADFGYILDRRLELNKYCYPDKSSNDVSKSSLECTKYFRTCRGNNLMIKFGKIPRAGTLLTTDGPKLIGRGDIGGWNCDLQLKRIPEEKGQEGVLQSWFAELKNYELIPAFNQSRTCELTIKKRVFLIKPDSPSNMYHYFCSFLNVYATMHLYNSFDEDIQIVIWDNRKPRSAFEQMWSVFSKNPLMTLTDLEGKRVCFEKFIFTLLPRMIDGLYYNTNLIPGCSKSGLFNSFNKHIMHKLRVPQAYDLYSHTKYDNKLIRITMVTRKTPHRRILNEEALREKVANESINNHVQLIDFSTLSFNEQVNITQNTDILIGIHGAGLTHTLLLPDWAALFEVYNCKDKCYYDLARLRGVNYFTLTNPNSYKKTLTNDKVELERLEINKLLDNDKFQNYYVHPEEFIDVLNKAIKRVKDNRRKHFKLLSLVDENTTNPSVKIEVNSREEL